MASKAAANALANNEQQLQNVFQYIEDYVDLLENVPNEVIRQVTQLHEQNHHYNQLSVQLHESMKLLIGDDAFDSDDSDSEPNSDKPRRSADPIDKTCDPVTSGRSNDEPVSDEMRTKALFIMQRCLLEMQEISDDKLQIVQSILDQLDLKGRVLDSNFRSISMSGGLAASLSGGSASSASKANHVETSHNRDSATQAIHDDGVKHDQGSSNDADVGPNMAHSSSKRASSRRNFSGGKHDADSNGTTTAATSGKRGVKRGVKGATAKESLKRNKGAGSNNAKDALNNSPNALYDEPPIDPDEPTYCLCEQVSFGEMICCDNSACSIEWFHFSCVALTTKPKGKWYCPNCRGDRSNIPKK
jgi:inhibitor-of-growth protein 1